MCEKELDGSEIGSNVGGGGNAEIAEIGGWLEYPSTKKGKLPKGQER